jgi:hypothetical protein
LKYTPCVKNPTAAKYRSDTVNGGEIFLVSGMEGMIEDREKYHPMDRK